LSKIKILCIDIEGGHGGSSRSLFYALEEISKIKNIQITVICRIDSWMKKEYKRLGIRCLTEKTIPRFTPLKKYSRNILQLLYFIFLYWPKSYSFRKRLLSIAKEVDLVHYNHVSLSFLAYWLKKKSRKTCSSMHVRTLPPNNYFTKFLTKVFINSCNAIIYITENEKRHVNNLITIKKNILEKIIFNPVKIQEGKKTYIKELKTDKRLKIGILSNLSYNRGVDRVIEIYECIPLKQREKFLFILAGDMKLEKNLPNIPNQFHKFGGSMKDFVNYKKYSKNFIFLGNVDRPEEVINSFDILLKPTRLSNPWGRDILEALAAGKPVISVGTYTKFVETYKTGVLQEKFNAKAIVDWLSKINKDRSLLKNYKKNAVKRIKILCNQKSSADNLLQTWLKIMNK